MALLAVCALFAVPLALLAGAVACERLGTSTATYRTTAVLEQDAPTEVITSVRAATRVGGEVRGRWTAADGSPREGAVRASAGARAGERVDVWLDAAGRPVRPPLRGAELMWLSALVTVGFLVVTGVLCGLVYGAVRGVLDHGRLAAWESEWERVERTWPHRG